MRLLSTFLFTIVISFFEIAFVYAQPSLDVLQYRAVGPTRGGRVTAVAGTAMEPGTFYLGATGGGIWKTTDYGTSWHNVSDGFLPTPSIGAISVAQKDPNIVYTGTGSDGLRSNVIVGKGVYKSIDAGNSWSPVGLERVGQIGALILHPEDHNTVFVAGIGQPFQANSERGIFRTRNGGRSWEKVLYLSDEIGFSDVEMLPGNPNILFATAWKAVRKPWTIISGGTAEEGGIYKSVDGGDTWDKVTKGLPGNLIGKIDVAVCPADSRVVYALVEAPNKEGGLYKSVDQGASFTQVSDFGGLRSRPFYYTNIRVNPQDCEVVYSLATGYYRSDNSGKDWQRMNPPHGDSHDMWINPDNPQLFIQANDGGANVTHNGGQTWSTQFNQPTAEIYQVEVDDQFPYWLYGGQQDNYTTIAVPSLPPDSRQAAGMGWVINTGGCETGPAVPKPGNHNIVYSNCKGRFGVFDKRTGVERSYYVGASNMYGHNPKDLEFRFQRVSPIHVSPHNPDVVYHTSQYVHRTKNDGQTWEIISPDLTAFEADKQVISGSPITRDITGEEFYSTIYAIRESPVAAGVIWVGANDGPVHLTRDNGDSWQNVTPASLPKGGRVDAVEPSPHDAAKAYIAVLRYQLGDWRPYLYRTNDYGKSWTLLSGPKSGIPQDFPTRVVREDPERAGVLYAGTEFGMFLSMDDGQTWKSFQQNLPVTPITDIKIHQGDLVLSTMGRGFWIMDNVRILHDEALADLAGEPYLFTIPTTIRHRSPMGRSNNEDLEYTSPGLWVDYFVPKGSKAPVELQISGPDGAWITTLASDSIKASRELVENMGLNQQEYLITRALSAKPGLQRYRWDMQARGPWSANKNRAYRNGALVNPGEYTVTMKVGKWESSQQFYLLPDPRVIGTGVSVADMKAQYALTTEITNLLTRARKLEQAWEKALKIANEDSSQKAYAEALSRALPQLQTEKDMIYPQPKLLDQIGYLGYMLRGADQRPGDDAYARLAELTKQLNELEENVEGAR
jgi:photosystem II stability/assembly factor-like uncharacterized protein